MTACKRCEAALGLSKLLSEAKAPYNHNRDMGRCRDSCAACVWYRKRDAALKSYRDTALAAPPQAPKPCAYCGTGNKYLCRHSEPAPPPSQAAKCGRCRDTGAILDDGDNPSGLPQPMVCPECQPASPPSQPAGEKRLWCGYCARVRSEHEVTYTTMEKCLTCGTVTSELPAEVLAPHEMREREAAAPKPTEKP